MKTTRQRGYNLVEIMIVLTVAAMMGSWLFAKYTQAQRDARINETERAIELIKDAIVDYAAVREIQSFLLTDSSVPNARQIRVPPGRPYLPCPDITNDGYEDRLPIVVTRTNPIAIAPIPDVPIVDAESYHDVRRILTGNPAPFQGCYRTKGLVPWRTLGTPPADAWGNRFTYRVDPDFADNMLGFDEQTPADASSPNGLVQNEPPYEYRNQSGVSLVMHRGSPLPFIGRIAATVTAPDVIAIWGTSIESNVLPSLICSEAPCGVAASDDDILAGALARSSQTRHTGELQHNIQTYGRFISPHITSGMPVVILSHGENGYGAVRADVDGYNCRPFPSPDESRQDEKQNAYQHQAPPAASAPGCDPMNPIRPEDTDAQENGFVYRKQSLGPPATGTDPETQEFDDVIGWMSVEELRAKLTRRGVFPADKLPPYGVENL